jgi:hypothetical protein
MSAIVTRTLTSTLARIDADFPSGEPHSNGLWHSIPGIMSAPYQVDLDIIKTKLGRFLAEHTSTTRRDDDDSSISLLSPWTVGDAEINEIASNAQMTQPSGLSAHKGQTLARLARLRAEIDRVEARVRTAAPGGHWDILRVISYDWPVFGSRRIPDAATPEAFYDACARDIRSAGAILLSAGMRHVPLPDGIAQTMAGGRGLQLLRKRFPTKSE